MITETQRGVVHIVDDDDGVRGALRYLIEGTSCDVRDYRDAHSFLDTFDGQRPCCVLLDLRMPGIGGLELQERLFSAGDALPVIILTGHGDVTCAVRAFKAGATDFIRKPFRSDELICSVHSSLEADARRMEQRQQIALIRGRFGRLTRRESEVMKLMVNGKLNKEIAYLLDISIKTVEIHRANVMAKTEAASLADLIVLHDRTRNPLTGIRH